MGRQARGAFKIESWDEQPYLETDGGGKLTRAKVTQAIEGDIDGRAEVEWLMCYRPDQTADFVGLERVGGRVGDRSGTFVLESTGTFDGKEAKGPLAGVRGSGTGELSGIVGAGEVSARMGGSASVSLDYDFE